MNATSARLYTAPPLTSEDAAVIADIHQIARRLAEAGATWTVLDSLRDSGKLPERVMEALFDAWIGYRVRRGGYMKRSGVEGHTATRDLALLAELQLLTANGSGRAGTTPWGRGSSNCGARRSRPDSR